MRIALVYPPPWKIPAPGQVPDPGGDGPPEGFRDGDIDADFLQTPYGLLSLAAQAIRWGHQVKVLNLSSFPWDEVERTIARLDADLFGMSSFTANRRGVGLVAKCIRAHHPSARIVVGGPHATALARETLSHHPEIDAVAIGEGEETLREVVERIGQGASLQGIAGLAWRSADQVEVGAPRARIAELDTLASPHGPFSPHLLMTSRGCPGSCSYCAKNAVWGKQWRAHSPAWVLSSLQHAAAHLPVKMLMIKDDTFTADRKRALEICRTMRERKLGLLWSCDTRADVLTEELVREMRLAGCQRISLGVESGSPSILKNIGKNITPDKVQAATKMARDVGLQVRWFMMLGNRGETAHTLRESLDFIRKGQPDQFIFACLSVYPGTRDFESLAKQGALDREVYFDGDFLELKMPFDASEQDTAVMSDWFERNKGLRELHRPGVEHYEAVLQRLGDFHAAHFDLASACYHDGQSERAEEHARRALDLGFPAPGLIWNLLGCIAASRSAWAEMRACFDQAHEQDPLHAVLARNRQAIKAWESSGGPLRLVASSEFQILERTQQPTLPGPLAADFDQWDS
ncbi:MAG: cobalamin B12-binding domain-containing protein [Deltaproteobacteria bacterium]|nr:cobalamin B12-binding domain-containing protein [Deltaproteobacteria bacterium]